MHRDAMTETSNSEPSDAARAMFMTALTTEHFVLQTAASTTVTEASARASLYMMSLSSSLVAIGFTSGTQALAPLVSTVIPVIVVLGIFTIVRLVDTGVKNVSMLTSIAHIRSFYRTLSPDAPSYFPSSSTGEAAGALASIAVKRPPGTNRGRRTWMGTKAVFTMASMIAVPNSVVAGAGVTLGLMRLTSKPVGFVIGSIVVVIALGTFYWYQNLRYQAIPASQLSNREVRDESAT
jgi:hypothetical protein